MPEPKHTRSDLHQMQSLPLEMKVKMTERRIKDWYEYYGGDVAVSFSGGKDSTVLLHICRNLYPDIKALYFNTGLEFPSLTRFVKSFDNVEIIKPKYSFIQIIRKYGYPIVTKQSSKVIYDSKVYIGKRREKYETISLDIGGGY